MSALRLVSAGACCWLLTVATGCQFVPRHQLSSCEVKSRSLVEQSNAQLAEIANLKSHSRKLENQLLKAEEELAIIDERTGLDRKRLVNYEQERSALREEMENLTHAGGQHT